MSKAKIFLSYSHKDRELAEKLCEHLAPLRHQGRAEVWFDRWVPIGLSWRREIDERLQAADIVVLLGSAAFLDSDPCREEMRRALSLQDEGRNRVVPVRLREFAWEGTEFDVLEALPRYGKPVDGCANIESAFAEVAREIDHLLGERQPVVREPFDVPAIFEHYVKVCRPFEDLGNRDALLQARALWKKALMLAQDAPDHPDTALILHQLGLVFLELGEDQAALDTLSRSQELSEGNSDAGLLASLRSHLAEACRRQGHLDRALDLSRKAVDAGEAADGDLRDRIARLTNLALVLAARNETELAKVCLREARELGLRFLEEVPELAACLHNLALLHMDCGELLEAERFLLEALAIDEKRFGSHHPEVALDRNSLGLLFARQGRNRAAREQFLQAHKTLAAVLGEDHPHTLTVWQNLLSLPSWTATWKRRRG